MVDKNGIIDEKQRYNAPFLRAFDMLAIRIAGGKQKNLAEMLGTYSSHISDYRKGKKRVSPEMMDALIRQSAKLPEGQFNRYYLTGHSQYMMLNNVPDKEFIEQQERENDPDYDVKQQQTTSGRSTETDAEKNIIDTATHLIVELEQLRRQTKNELALLAQARQSFENATAELRNLIQSQRGDYFPGLAAEDTENK